ncbi:MAG: molybdopterin-dependent oxidoreductase [Octadecabacter sp.]|jgi:biotin/methionine sulfoxide reductase|nr:molybdopterin-dependent oxidoreductase [Octadecabacter sp.]
MTNKYTSSHWGTFRVETVNDQISLHGLPQDDEPAQIAKGWVSAMKNPNARIARPAFRKGWLNGRDHDRSGDAVFVQLPWDEALDITAQELKRVIAEYGNKALFAGSYGWASAGRFHHAQSQLRRFLNTIGGFVGAKNTYSHAAAEVLLSYVTGLPHRMFQDQMTSMDLIAEHCELLVCFGGISARTAQVSSSGTTRHEVTPFLNKAAANGCKIINISPRGRDMNAELSADWIALRPGTDTAFILALAYEVFRAGRADRVFLDTYTQGADAFEAYVMGDLDEQPKTADWAAAICDIPAERIRKLATQMTSSRTMISMAWSLQRGDHGEQPIWAGLALAAMLGQIGQAGTGFGFGYGSTTPVGRSRKLINWPSVPQGRNPIADFIPVARVTDMLNTPNGAYKYDGEDRIYPDAKLVWWSGGNPFHHHQDLLKLDTAWRKPETVIVMDHSWTATARRADIVLPTTGPLERDDIMINRRDDALVYMSAVQKPFKQARDDYEILSNIAARMGTSDAFTEGRTADGWLRHLCEGCAAVGKTEGFELPDFETFKDLGIVTIPNAHETRILMDRFIADPATDPLQTPSGKIEIACQAIADLALHDCHAHPMWHEPVERLGACDPDHLHLISGQPATRLHAQLDMGAEAQASKVQGREPCALHSKTAKRFGLTAGDIVLLENARGACLGGLTLDDTLREDCIFMATGAWLDLQDINGRTICVHGNVNVLTIDKGASDLSQGNIAHTTLVKIRKWTGPLPALRVTGLPVLD